MGKRILTQRRGRGGIQYRAPIKGKVGQSKYPSLKPDQTFSGKITAIMHDRGRSAPLIRMESSLFPPVLLPAVHGMSVGSIIHIGPDASSITGNILPLKKIPEGSQICNIELTYGDGGKLIRASGVSATLFSHTADRVIIRMPSGRTISLPNQCRATIGNISGGGRLEKPFLRAGKKFYAHKSKVHAYPRPRGVAMAAVNHPFGGGRHQHPGKSTATPRNAPPGRKVGHLAPRKTGPGRVARKIIEVKR